MGRGHRAGWRRHYRNNPPSLLPVQPLPQIPPFPQAALKHMKPGAAIINTTSVTAYRWGVGGLWGPRRCGRHTWARADPARSARNTPGWGGAGRDGVPP
jgi:hypothetical protein